MNLQWCHLGFQLTLFQPGGGADYAQSITACSPRLENLTASLYLWHILISLIFSIPDLESAAKQLAKKCKEHKVDTVFIATDAPMSEYVDIKEFLKKEDIKVRI